MPTFDLLTQPWIPASPTGSENGGDTMYGVRDVLLRAHELTEIRAASPLITAALHRVLLAVVHRSLGSETRAAGPASVAEWRDLWQQGHFDAAQTTRYLDTWQHRFDLFDAEKPFYQTAHLDYSYQKFITNLTHEWVTEGPTLFDHTTYANSPAFSPALAAQYLVAQQAFALGGLLTYERKEDKSADGALLAKGALLLVQGETLFETLMLNLHRYHRADEQPFPLMSRDDAPAWERDGETVAEDRRPNGYLDWLTWQSRRIRLHPTEESGGTAMVRHVVIMKGNQLPDDYKRFGHETMLAFRINKDAKSPQDPTPVISFQPEKALWRDSLTLMQTLTDARQRPKMLDWLNELCVGGALDRSRIVPLTAYGLGSDRAKIFFWRAEQLPLPLAYLADDQLLLRVQAALAHADEIGRVLRDTARVLARYVFVSDPPVDQRQRDDLYRARSKDIDALRDALAPGRQYWSELDTPFARFLVAQAQEAAARPTGETEVPIGSAFIAWGDAVGAAAQADVEAMIGGLDSSARMMKAVVQARAHFNGLRAYWRKRAGFDRKEGAEHE